jgi:hypothetical protein
MKNRMFAIVIAVMMFTALAVSAGAAVEVIVGGGTETCPFCGANYDPPIEGRMFHVFYGGDTPETSSHCMYTPCPGCGERGGEHTLLYEPFYGGWVFSCKEIECPFCGEMKFWGDHFVEYERGHFFYNCLCSNCEERNFVLSEHYDMAAMREINFSRHIFLCEKHDSLSGNIITTEAPPATTAAPSATTTTPPVTTTAPPATTTTSTLVTTTTPAPITTTTTPAPPATTPEPINAPSPDDDAPLSAGSNDADVNDDVVDDNIDDEIELEEDGAELAGESVVPEDQDSIEAGVVEDQEPSTNTGIVVTVVIIVVVLGGGGAATVIIIKHKALTK